ncbi:hypothetical protein ERO13_A01G058700v2 [Gossypium hirsutum]|uniref:Uncharacterized protein n=4 Tax=Gossypium TaxID=3633 RepID=A0A5J5WSY6_GOSBA|nr:hypothetical protein ES319_A01G058200v1 [Gossypium barbadense]KAG4213460.1 hypothetical protein ERO13_A01G058700v2 [Gossypium hirsutum]TYH30055.1 hypothetical protein ES288_A01G063400v1 [Gossypium darwinii]TYI42042.1 hypothetical protein ES332_A01G070800v1 [Gossypium tomentosum]TYJ48405.1 hypothetical protein E1A91_A01G059800v1 [Gossypium mustelinum]
MVHLDSAVRRSGETCEGGRARSHSWEPNSLAYSRSFWCSQLLYSFLGVLGLGFGLLELGFRIYLIGPDFM